MSSLELGRLLVKAREAVGEAKRCETEQAVRTSMAEARAAELERQRDEAHTEWAAMQQTASQWAARVAELERRADYLQREINIMRRAMQDAGTWERFCSDYAAYKARREAAP